MMPGKADVSQAFGESEPMAEKTVIARKFLLKDPQGDTRGRLGFYGSDDSPRIRLIDSILQERVSIGIANDYPGVAILNANASVSFIIGCAFPNASGVMINDELGLFGITILIQSGSPGQINIYDPDVQTEGEAMWSNIRWQSSQCQQ